MQATAVILGKPLQVALGPVVLADPGPDDIVVDVTWSGVSTGTERLLWTGQMPPFPGLAYPLVPGYETVGQVVEAGTNSGRAVGETVFVPGSSRYVDVRGLFGGASSRIVVEGRRVVPLSESIGDRGVLLALSATAYHVMTVAGANPPDLIVGHGVLGRLLARIVIALGHPPPVVWETNPERRAGAAGYQVCDPVDDERRDYAVIVDCSGNADILDSLIARTARGGQVVLAGFYEARPAFAFPPAFMRELTLRIAAEWQPEDLTRVSDLIANERLSLDGLITNREQASNAAEAYQTAFGDPSCLKMILDWRTLS